FKHLDEIMIVSDQQAVHIFMNMVTFPTGKDYVTRHECQTTTDQGSQNAALCNRHRILTHKAERNDQIGGHKHDADNIVDSDKAVGEHHENQHDNKAGGRIVHPYQQQYSYTTPDDGSYQSLEVSLLGEAPARLKNHQNG